MKIMKFTKPCNTPSEKQAELSSTPIIPLHESTQSLAIIRAKDHPPVMNMPGVWVKSGASYLDISDPYSTMETLS